MSDLKLVLMVCAGIVLAFLSLHLLKRVGAWGSSKLRTFFFNWQNRNQMKGFGCLVNGRPEVNKDAKPILFKTIEEAEAYRRDLCKKNLRNLGVIRVVYQVWDMKTEPHKVTIHEILKA